MKLYFAIALLAVAGCASKADDKAERFAARLESLEDRMNQIMTEHNRHLCEEHADRYECVKAPSFLCESESVVKCPTAVIRREEVWP